MITNGLEVEDGTTFEADICVVGAGAAGLTLALELAQRGLEVLLVESGGLQFRERSHELLDIELSGRSSQELVQFTRERFFGGTTNHWGGEIRTFGAFEFEPHPWVPNSGWPITRSDLDPYYIQAAELLGLTEVDRPYDAAAFGFGEYPRLVSETEMAVQAQQWGKVPNDHLRLGQARRKETFNTRSVHCLLNTTITEIHPDASRERIESVEGRTYDGATLHFRAREFVLCTGAIENPRLLLASDSVVPGGLGNEHDLVGRYFMDHPSAMMGPLLVTDPVGSFFQEELLADSGMVGWATTPETRTEFQLQGFMAIQWPKAPRVQEPLPHALGIRKLVGSAGEFNPDVPPRYLNVAVNWEQSPNPLSRVTLSKKLDALGVRKPDLHWEVTAGDIASAHKSSELLCLAVARSGHGRLRRLELQDMPGVSLTIGGGHQMGTTRMSDDPSHGVTDANGRVHSIENLFIGGSSLFPTGGWQNPTFTIMALTLRQADFLASRAGLPVAAAVKR
ncbi:MAG: GMC family oxidoreductase [Halioglobus sp.]|nr:GMC family oxidoreductase [Halioglobus sp.]